MLITSRDYSKQNGLYHNQVVSHVYELLKSEADLSIHFLKAYEGGTEEEPNIIFYITAAGIAALDKYIFIEPKSINM